MRMNPSAEAPLEHVIDIHPGCKHFYRRCQIRAPCCGEVFDCHLCHNEAMDHTIRQEEVLTMVCLVCYTEQPVAQACRKCFATMGEYYCSKCKLFDNKQMFHCNGCRICKKGKREEYYHCVECVICFPAYLRDHHRCVKLRRRCTFCDLRFLGYVKGEYLNCAHAIHKECALEMKKNHAYLGNCPKCLDESLNSTQELRNPPLVIRCSDSDDNEPSASLMSNAGKKMESGRLTVDWTSLPHVIWILILEKVGLDDFVRCKAVSTFFLGIIKGNKLRGGSQPRVPWVLEKVEESTDYWTLFDIASNKVHKILLPELRESTILGSSHGWLILAEKKSSNLQLFNPFTREQCDLPPITAFPGVVGAERDANGQVTQYLIKVGFEPDKFVQCKPHVLAQLYFKGASIFFCSTFGDTVVVRHAFDGFGVARLRDKSGWMDLRIPNQGHDCNFTFSCGSLYVMGSKGQLFSFNLDCAIPQPDVQMAPPAPIIFPAGSFEEMNKFLVALPENGDILLLLSLGTDSRLRSYKLVQCRRSVYWVEVGTLFDHSLFLTSRSHDSPTMTCISEKDFQLSVKGDSAVDQIEKPAVGNIFTWLPTWIKSTLGGQKGTPSCSRNPRAEFKVEDHLMELKSNCLYITEPGEIQEWDVEKGTALHPYPMKHISRKVPLGPKGAAWVAPVRMASKDRE